MTKHIGDTFVYERAISNEHLNGASFKDLSIHSSSFSEVSYINTLYRGVDISKTSMSSIALKMVRVHDLNIANDLSINEAILENVIIDNRHDLKKTKVDGTIIANSVFSRGHYTDLTIDSTAFINVLFDRCTFINCSFTDTSFTGCSFYRCAFNNRKAVPVFSDCHFKPRYALGIFSTFAKEWPNLAITPIAVNLLVQCMSKPTTDNCWGMSNFKVSPTIQEKYKYFVDNNDILNGRDKNKQQEAYRKLFTALTTNVANIIEDFALPKQPVKPKESKHKMAAFRFKTAGV